jgi:hypothetical protein
VLPVLPQGSQEGINIGNLINQLHNSVFMARKLLWIARVISIFYVIFLSVISIDALGSGLGNLIIRLIPAFVLLAALLAAIKWPLAGGILYIALGMFYIAVLNSYGWLVYTAFSVPLVLTGILYLINWKKSSLLLDS